MKKVYIFLLSVLLGFSVLAQQTTITIGDGLQTTGYAPCYDYYSFGLSQSIYTLEQVGQPGVISSIAYQSTNNSGQRLCKVYMGETPKDSYLTSEDFVAEANLTLVFEGVFVYQANTWSQIELDTAFNYTGAGNLVIAVIDNSGTFQMTTTKWRASKYNENRVIYSLSDDMGSTSPSLAFGSVGGLCDTMPDIQLTMQPVAEDYCYPPAFLQVLNSTPNSLEVSWKGGLAATGYNVQIKLLDASWDDVQVFSTADTTMLFENLEENTAYNIRVQSTCNSLWAEAIFKTPCQGVSILPWQEDFSAASPTNSSLPECWQVFQSYTTYMGEQFPRLQNGCSTCSSSGVASLVLRGAKNVVGLNAFEQNLSDLRLWFNASTTAATLSNAGLLEVGVMLNRNDTSSFVVLKAVENMPLNSAALNRVGPFDFNSLTDYDLTNAIIALRYTNTNYNTTWYLDDFKVDLIPSCPAPENFSVVASEVTSSSATISWTDLNPEHSYWTVYYRLEGEQTWQQASSFEQSAVIELEPASTYEVKVATSCEGLEEDETNSIFFTTSTPMFELPYSNDFESNDPLLNYVISGTDTYNHWIVGQEKYFPMADQTHNHAMYISDSNEHYHCTSPGTYDANRYYSIAAFSVEFPQEEMEYHLAFDFVSPGAYNTYSNAAYEGLGVFMVDLNQSIQDHVPEGADTLMPYTFNVNDWTHKDIILSNVVGQGKKIIFSYMTMGYSMFHNSTPAAVDNLEVFGNDCTQPSNLQIETLNSNSVDISWQENGQAAQWNVYYKTSEQVEWVHEVCYQSSYNISLEPNTLYQIKVSSECPSGESTATDVLSPNEAVTLPYSQDFASDFAIEDFLLFGTDTINHWVIGTAEHSTLSGSEDNYSLYISSDGNTFNAAIPQANTYDKYYNYAVLTVEFPEEEQEYHLSFDYKVQGFGQWNTCFEGLSVYLLDLQTEVNEQNLENINPILSEKYDSPQWVNFDYVMTDVAATSKKVVFVYNTYGYAGYHNSQPAAVDNLHIYSLDCIAPTSLNISEITHNSALVTIEGVTESYILSYRASGEEQYTDIEVDGSQYQLTGLEALTTYEVSVISSCESNALTTTFSTYITPVSLPYSTSFAMGEDTAWNLINGQCTNRWYIGALASSLPNGLFVSNNGTAANYSTGSASHVIAEKSFILGEDSVIHIEFDAIVGGEYDYNAYDYMKAFFVPADTIFQASNTNYFTPYYAMVDYSVNALEFNLNTELPYILQITDGVYHFSGEVHNPAPNQVGKLVFVWVNDFASGSQPSAIVSNILVGQQACTSPQIAITDLTPYQATLQINGQSDGYQVDFKELDSQQWNTLTTTDNQVIIDQLQPNTYYLVHVYSVCEDGLSALPSTLVFKTLCEAISDFPYQEGFEEGLSCWTTQSLLGSNTWQTDIDPEIQLPAYEGSRSAVFYVESYGITSELVSPMFDFEENSMPILYFYHMQRAYLDDQDTLALFYRTSPEDQWHHIVSWLEEIEDWTLDSVFLPQASSQYQIRFVAGANYGYGVQLDAVKIEIPVICVDTVLDIEASICQGEQYDFYGQLYSDEGVYQHETLLDNGCTELVVLYLTVNPVDDTIIDNVEINYGETYHWYGSDYNQTGQYFYYYQNQYNCTCVAVLNLIVNEGLDELATQNSVKLSPNPAKDMIYLTLNQAISKGKILITDVQGKGISTLEITSPQTIIPLAVGHLQPGVYYLHLQSDTYQHTEKIIIY